MNNKIAIIGLGYVGLPLAVEFGKKFQTIGFDINEKRIAELKNGFDRTDELTNENLKLSSKLEYTSDTRKITDCNIYIITVPTPIHNDNKPNLEPIKSASEMVSRLLKKMIWLFTNQQFFLDVLKKFVFLFLSRILA